MRPHRLALFALLIAASLGFGASSASAKLSAQLTVQPDGSATRIIATLTSDKPVSKRKRPTSVQLRLAGKTLVLSRQQGAAPAGTVGSYRSSRLTGSRASAAQALIGKSVKLTAVAPAGRSTVRATAQAPGVAANPGAGTPSPAPTTTPTPAPTPAPLFTKPATALTGNAAYDAIKGYVANATLTDCVAGWPNCAVELRTSIAQDGSFAWCRLTSTSGADVNNYGTINEIVGADQALDGSWAVSFRETSSGFSHHYTWRVAADGSASIQYWDASASIAGPPSEVYTGFTWRPGYSTCAI